MQILIQDRVKVALRSLSKAEHREIMRALGELSIEEQTLFFKNPHLHKLAAGPSAGKDLYVYLGSPKLRLVLSVNENTCTIEDVIEHARLDRLNLLQRQE